MEKINKDQGTDKNTDNIDKHKALSTKEFERIKELMIKKAQSVKSFQLTLKNKEIAELDSTLDNINKLVDSLVKAKCGRELVIVSNFLDGYLLPSVEELNTSLQSTTKHKE